MNFDGSTAGGSSAEIVDAGWGGLPENCPVDRPNITMGWRWAFYSDALLLDQN